MSAVAGTGRPSAGRPVDIVIAVHDERRPLARAVASVLHDGVARPLVVCHEIDPESTASRLRDELGASGADVRVVGWSDGVRSPAGPFNHGLGLATAGLVGVMGSDDWVEPGALAAWVRRAEGGAAVVLGRLRHQSGEAIRAPLARPGRRTRLDVARDRLAYRTAPLGLLRRSTVERRGLRFAVGLATGEDLAFGLRLWTSGERIDYARSAPAYVIGADAAERTTTTARPLRDELEAVDRVLTEDWMRALAPAHLRAVAVKLVRVHLLGAADRRPARTDWAPGDREYLRGLLRSCRDLAPGVLDPFAVADRRVLDAVTSGSDEDLVGAIGCRRNASRADRLRTPRWRHLLDREGTLRRFANYAVTR